MIEKERPGSPRNQMKWKLILMVCIRVTHCTARVLQKSERRLLRSVEVSLNVSEAVKPSYKNHFKIFSFCCVLVVTTILDIYMHCQVQNCVVYCEKVYLRLMQILEALLINGKRRMAQKD